MVIGLLMIAGGFGAGLFGSLLGLGGGLLIVPLLTLGFGLPVRDAVGVSLVAVIATSGASAGIYLGRHLANLRLGMTLELFTAAGALVGALVAFAVPERAIAGLFVALLAYVAASMIRSLLRPASVAGAGQPLEPATPAPSPSGAAAGVGEPASGRGRPVNGLGGRLGGRDYEVRNLPAGIAGSVVAGLLSALLGVGGGIVKVPVMHLAMGVPMRAATATSNLMIGITATSSAIIYLVRGGIDPLVAGPTVLGVFAGANLGSRTGHRFPVRGLQVLFVVVVLYTAWLMLGRVVG